MRHALRSGYLWLVTRRQPYGPRHVYGYRPRRWLSYETDPDGQRNMRIVPRQPRRTLAPETVIVKRSRESVSRKVGESRSRGVEGLSPFLPTDRLTD
jgi:hypothetical protein